MLTVPCFAALLLLAQPPVDDGPVTGVAKADEIAVDVIELGGTGRLGASAGHLLVAPFAFALPGGGVDLRAGHTLKNELYAHGRLSFSLGVDESGTVGGGYRGRGGLGLTWLDVGWFAFGTEAHVGVSSFSLIPVPAAGLRAAARLRPVRLEHFFWELGADLETELLLIVPRAKVGAHTAVVVPFDGFHVGLAAEGDAEAIVAVLANVVSATGGIRLFVGFTY